MIDLRSDTFTLPTPEMLQAMVTSPLGDDGYGEDPTVNKLERLTADKLRKEAACLMPSGTMANLASILAHCRPDTRVLVGDKSDIFVYEHPGSVYGGVTYQPVPTQADGQLLLEDLELAIQQHPQVPVKLLCIENPHNLCGGTVLKVDYLKSLAEFAHDYDIPLHLDGARLFNAAVALGVSAAECAQHADSIQFCMSKGLSAPIGSLVVGPDHFVGRVRAIRKMLGGGMRQAGIIAAAGIIAIEKMADRLVEDHRNARHLAQGLVAIEGIEVDLTKVQTNVVVFRVLDGRFTVETFLGTARENGLLMSEFKYGRIRAVLRNGTSMEDAEKALRIIADVCQNGPSVLSAA